MQVTVSTTLLSSFAASTGLTPLKRSFSMNGLETWEETELNVVLKVFILTSCDCYLFT